MQGWSVLNDIYISKIVSNYPYVQRETLEQVINPALSDLPCFSPSPTLWILRPSFAELVTLPFGLLVVICLHAFAVLLLRLKFSSLHKLNPIFPLRPCYRLNICEAPKFIC